MTSRISLEDLMNMNVFEDIYNHYTNDRTTGILPDHYTFHSPTVQPAITSPTKPFYNSPAFWNTTITTKDLQTYQISPHVEKTDCKVEVRMDDNSVEHITREELLKYIDERKIIQDNELVRKLYERFQVALKLARSDDNGDTGV